MKAVALIPARIGSTRFPRKMLASLRGKTVIRRTYESAVRTGLFADVIVVSDDDDIIAEVISCGGKAVKSSRTFESGTDRIAEVVAGMEADVFVNIQGDEPFVQREPLRQLLGLFEESGTLVGSLVQELSHPEFIEDPNFVKVALDLHGNALFFSRSVIPYPRNTQAKRTYYEHIGVYAFTKPALMQFVSWPVSPLEDIEKVECLRFLENGIRMRMAITRYMGVEIDTPEDIQRAEAIMDEKGWE
ncbi:3-deoxy-manno-octulosonate cytidylyltransferase [Rurimicrobium arvi]